MYPRLPITDAPYCVQRDAVCLRDSRQGVAFLPTGPNNRNIGLSQSGRLLCTPAWSAFRSLARAIVVSSRQAFRQAPRWISIAVQQALLGRSVSDVVSLCSKPQMGRITARWRIADVKDANAFRTKSAFVSERTACGELVSDPMGETHLSIPLHLAVAIVVKRPNERPAGIRFADHNPAPEAFRTFSHNAIVAEGV